VNIRKIKNLLYKLDVALLDISWANFWDGITFRRNIKKLSIASEKFNRLRDIVLNAKEDYYQKKG
jgi:hypothetical protein